MKTLGTKSLSTVLSRVIQVVWWIELVAAVCITAAVIVSPFFQKEVKFNTPVTFSNVNVKNVTAAVPDMQGGQLSVTDGRFYFPVQTNFTNTLIMAVIVVGAFSFLILITYQLKQIFSSFERNEPFMEINIKRIRKIGIILIVYVVAQLLYNIAVTKYLVSHFNWDTTELTYSINLIALFIGITMIVIAEIFKLGTFLEEDQKLTI